MKQFIYITAVILLLMSAIGCTKEYNPELKLPVNTELRVSSYANLYDVAVEEDNAWVVKSHPDWVAPMKESGSFGEKISLFVEDNFEEEERQGEMLVITDKHEIVYSITQKSFLTEDENAEIVSDNVLSLTYGVGYGINVFGTPSMGKYKFAGAIVNPANLANTLAAVGEPDAWCSEDHYFSQTESISGTSTTSLSTQLSVNAGIEVEISAFSGSVSGKFTSTESSKMETAYAMREIKHIVGSRYLRPGILRSLSAENCDCVFAQGFYKLAQSIKNDPGKVSYIKKLLDNYGTHLVVHGTLGGELELAMEMTSTEKISEMDINAALNLSSEVVNGDAGFSMNDSQKELAKNTKISLKTYGGNNVYTIKPGTTFEEAMKEALSASQLNSWVASIKDKSSLALIDVQLYPIYDLMPDEASRDAVREYLINEYQKSKTKEGPLTFAVNGFGDNGVITGEAYIPQIDVKLECYQEMVPEISEDEPVIIIYSGTEEEMNYDRGFFIGSKTMQPGKLRRDREGKYTFESFEDLECAQVTELYVNAAGDITIAGKPGVDYSEVKFTGITQEDLDKNRISESEDIKGYVYYGKEQYTSNYWHASDLYASPDEFQGIRAAAQGLTDKAISSLISEGRAILVYSCTTDAALSYSAVLGFDNADNKVLHEFKWLDGPEVEWEISLPNTITNILIYMEMDIEYHLSEGWKWEEKPYLRLKMNYDNTPRWRK